MADTTLSVYDRPIIKTPQELVHIKHRINLLQYKYWVLMLRAYREAYEEKGRILNDDEYCFLPMKRLAEYIGYEPKTTEIEHDLEVIRKEPIIFNVLEKDGQKGKSGRGFISEWFVSSNRVGVIFPRLIREAIENLDSKESIFHLLNWSVFNSFTGKYEAVLYKLCKDYIGVGKTPFFSLEKFRGYMGIKDNEYNDFKRLNQWVISGPIKRINESELSDITIAAEFKRESRRVIGLWFVITPKKQTAMDFGDDPAFRFAKVTVSLANQKKYIEAKGRENVELSLQRANEYAEDQEKNGKEVNYGAIYRKAIDEDWGKEYQEKKARETDKLKQLAKSKANEKTENQKKRYDDAVSEFQRIKVVSNIKALTKADLEAKMQSYKQEVGEGRATSWNQEKSDFTDVVERAQFNGWLRKSFTEAFDQEEFLLWLKEKNMNPKELGIEA